MVTHVVDNERVLLVTYEGMAAAGQRGRSNQDIACSNAEIFIVAKLENVSDTA